MGVNGIYGLSGSGIDVESMVKVGMMTKQSEYDKMYKKSIKETWEKEAYASIYSDLSTFKETVATYNKQSTMNAMTASSSNTSAVTATANGAAAAMSHTVRVQELATNAYLLSKNAIVRDSSSTASASSIYLKDVAFGGITSDSDGKYTVQRKGTYGASGDTTNLVKISYNDKSYSLSDLKTTDGTTYTLSGTAVSLSDLAFSVSSDGGKNYTSVSGSDISLNTTSSTIDKTTTYTINSLTAYTSSTVEGTDTALSYTINDGSSSGTVTYTYADLVNGKTLNDLSADLNDLNLNFTANYDSTNDAFSIYNNTGGTTNQINITSLTDDTTELFDNLQLASTDGTTMGTVKSFTTNTADSTAGTNGVVTIDGKTYDNLTTNKLLVSGVSYSFLAVTDTTTTATDGTKTTTAGTASVSISQDTDSVIQSVKDFVTAYNKMLDEINDKIYETKYSDYEPLTKSQESAMTTSQVSDWNEKAKSGILYNSAYLKSITSNMREAIYTPVDSVESDYNSASAIGITSSTSKGHLTLDEDKLKKALAADPDCVYQIFGSLQDSDATDSLSVSSDYKNTGIANRLYFDTTTQGLSTLKNYSGTSDDTDDGSYLGTLISNLQTKMSNFKVQMSAYEELLYNKYDAMETAIATLSSQLSSVTSS